jgi:SAM-dependent methyltransferase
MNWKNKLSFRYWLDWIKIIKREICAKFMEFKEAILFDIINRINTAPRVEKKNLHQQDVYFESNNCYVASQTSQIKLVLNKLIKIDPDVLNFNFYDLGSGKGKVLILAHRIGFKKIFGVEISKELHELCKLNLKKLKINDIVLINKNALDLNMLKDNSVFYFYNSFEKKILDIVLNNIYNSLRDNNKTGYIICNDLKSLVNNQPFQLDNQKYSLIFNQNDTKFNSMQIYKIKL